MRQILFLIMLLASTALAAFDTTPVPNQHAAIVSFQCDDRVDTQFVHIANEFGININFAPYRLGGTQIQDYDSNFTAASGYTDFAIRYGDDKGMSFAMHSQSNSPTVVVAGGRDSLTWIWDSEGEWLENVLTRGLAKTDERLDPTLGYVWTGHVNSPEVRAMAMEHGFTYTRGNLSDSKDLYLSKSGWLSSTGGTPFPPACMTHRALIPSISMYRLTTAMVGDSLYQTSTASDTTHLWRGTLNFLNNMAAHNGFGVLNIHPGWGLPYSETEADTIVTSWVQIPDNYAGAADSILFGTRRGVTGRNDVSGYQLSYILKAMEWWSDSTADVDGVTRLCVPDLNAVMLNQQMNWRNDNSSDPDAVSDWSPSKAAGSTTNDYWESNTGLYARDPALQINRVTYIDGSGTVKAGNGTAQYPLPAGAIMHLFNTKVVYTGHAVGDTLVLPRPSWRGANVDVDFAGLTIEPSAVNATALMLDSTSTNVYLHNITLRNFTMDQLATTATTSGLHIGNSGSQQADSTRVTDVLIKGATFINGEQAVYAYNANRVTIDSCFFYPGLGAITDNGSTWPLFTGAYLKGGLVRNSVFDMNDSGGNAGSGQSGAIQMVAHGLDSLRILNNVFLLGNSADTDDPQAVIRTPAVNSSLKLRLSGNYISDAIVGSTAAGKWLFTTGYAALSLSQLADTLALYNSGVYVPVRNYRATGWGIGGYDYLTEHSDTLYWGGYTGPGTAQPERRYASIGPLLYTSGPQPYISAAQSAGFPAYSKKTLDQLVDLYETRGILADSDPLDPTTYIPVKPAALSDPAGLANQELFIESYMALPDSTRDDLRITF